VEPSDILRAPVKRSKSLLRTLWGTATLPVKLVVSWDVEGWRLTCRMGADAMLHLPYWLYQCCSYSPSQRYWYMLASILYCDVLVNACTHDPSLHLWVCVLVLVLAGCAAVPRGALGWVSEIATYPSCGYHIATS
jgi:hypothetical protein